MKQIRYILEEELLEAAIKQIEWSRAMLENTVSYNGDEKRATDLKSLDVVLDMLRRAEELG